MEFRYGKRQLTRLVAEYQERRLNQEWLEAHAMGCPGCETKVEKSEGEQVVCTKRVPLLIRIFRLSPPPGCNHVGSSERRKLSKAYTFSETSDEMCEVLDTFLLSLWPKAPRRQPLSPLLYQGSVNQ